MEISLRPLNSEENTHTHTDAHTHTARKGLPKERKNQINSKRSRWKKRRGREAWPHPPKSEQERAAELLHPKTLTKVSE